MSTDLLLCISDHIHTADQNALLRANQLLYYLLNVILLCYQAKVLTVGPGDQGVGGDVLKGPTDNLTSKPLG